MCYVGKYEFIIGLYNKFFYIRESYNIEDFSIAILCGLQVKEYQDVLLTNYNAFLRRGQIYFTARKDAENALSWVESMVIMKNLMS